MSRSNRHVDRYTDIRQQTQADVERAEMWQRIHERKARSQKTRGRIVAGAFVICWVVMIFHLWRAWAA